MTKERKNIQIILLFIGLLILFATYFLYPKIKGDKLSKDVVTKQDQIAIEKSSEYLGEWASSRLGKNKEEEEVYIEEIIKSNLEKSGQENVFKKIKKDFKEAAVDIKDSEIRDQMKEALSRAKKDIIEIEEGQTNTFQNVEYKGMYNINNPFSVKSDKAHILKEEPDVIYMTNMKATITLTDGRTVIITSDKGRYNKKTYDTFFEINVKATDGETIVLSDNLDLLSSQDSSAIYNNVIITNETEGSLVADKIDYNFETRYYRISMYNNESVKVKLMYE